MPALRFFCTPTNLLAVAASRYLTLDVQEGVLFAAPPPIFSTYILDSLIIYYAPLGILQGINLTFWGVIAVIIPPPVTC